MNINADQRANMLALSFSSLSVQGEFDAIYMQSINGHKIAVILTIKREYIIDEIYSRTWNFFFISELELVCLSLNVMIDIAHMNELFCLCVYLI